jgi:hypothetical protein
MPADVLFDPCLHQRGCHGADSAAKR